MDRVIKTIYTSAMTALPPLAAIRVFESVARHGNFSRAAAELNMTQSAVSYQIKLLESFVGAPLFVRQARGVALSEKGDIVAPTVRRALGDLAQCFRLVREESNSVLVISTMQTIAGNWLAPRLGGFQLLHPEYTVRLDISPNMADLESEGVDVVIRSGKGNLAGPHQPLPADANFHAGLQPSLHRPRRPPRNARTNSQSRSH